MKIFNIYKYLTFIETFIAFLYIFLQKDQHTNFLSYLFIFSIANLALMLLIWAYLDCLSKIDRDEFHSTFKSIK